MNLPATIKHQNGFLHSPAAGYDGVFDWSWTQGCFGKGRITPMDFDGVVERKGNFILFETKNLGVPIPDGQMYTLKAAHRLGCFTIFLIHGKTEPESAQIWYPGVDKREVYEGVDVIKSKVSAWYTYADKNPKNGIDVSFLNRRVEILGAENESMKSRIDAAALLAEQLLIALRGRV